MSSGLITSNSLLITGSVDHSGRCKFAIIVQKEKVEWRQQQQTATEKEKISRIAKNTKRRSDWAYNKAQQSNNNNRVKKGTRSDPLLLHFSRPSYAILFATEFVAVFGTVFVVSGIRTSRWLGRVEEENLKIIHRYNELKNAPKRFLFSIILPSSSPKLVLRQNKQKPKRRKKLNEEKLITVNCMKL